MSEYVVDEAERLLAGALARTSTTFADLLALPPTSGMRVHDVWLDDEHERPIVDVDVTGGRL